MGLIKALVTLLPLASVSMAAQLKVTDADNGNALGCLNVKGHLTASDCASFTTQLVDEGTFTLHSSSGSCSFTDLSQPSNPDVPAADPLRAFICGFTTNTKDTRFYDIGNGVLAHDTMNFLDVPVTAPPAAGQEVSVWTYLFTQSTPAGHSKAKLVLA